MNWIWILPVILVIALLWTFHPVFLRRGGDPLPVGLEGDLRAEWMTQKESLLLQLKEMELERAPDPMAATTRTALERELAALLTRIDNLKTTPGQAAIVPSAIPKGPLDIAMAISVMLFITVTTGLLYLFMGTPRTVAPSSAQPQVNAHEIATMVEQAAKRLQANPDDIPGWMRLARSYQVMNRPNDAMAAYTHVLTRQPDLVDAIVALAELELHATDPQRQQSGKQRLQTLLTQHPDHPEALWLLGGAAFRNGDSAQALALLNRLKAILPPGSESAKTVEQAIEQIRKP
ncbi:MAG: tetratricopeptide repeat protein [Magnetococcales bacterium]|nr:tetratricopeptide repeat protein [Magnetococcales bacterium]